MYCSTCGAAFPSTSHFCPQCGKPALKEDPVHGWQAAETANDTGTANAAFDSDTAENQEADKQAIATAQPNSNSIAVPGVPSTMVSGLERPKHTNPGSIVLVVFSVLCLIFGVMHGFIPIFLIAAGFFGGLAVERHLAGIIALRENPHQGAVRQHWEGADIVGGH